MLMLYLEIVNALGNKYFKLICYLGPANAISNEEAVKQLTMFF